MERHRVFAVLCIAFASLLILSSMAQALRQKSDKINPYLAEQLDKLEDDEKAMVEVYFNNKISERRFNSLLASVDVDDVIEQFYPESFVAKLTKKQAFNVAGKRYVESIEYTSEIGPLLQDAVVITRAVEVWPLTPFGQALTGQGQAVCVVDTGADLSHPDLVGNSVFSCNLDCYGSPTCAMNCSALDNIGHGTRVSGIVAASGGITGISPGAHIISLKATSNTGATSSTTPMKRAIDWCRNNADNYNISAITISLGTSFPDLYSSACDPQKVVLSNSVNAAIAQNVSVIAASGNDGSITSISYPSCLENAISVGATNKDDTYAIYSNYNPVLVNLLAPGTDINSTSMGGGYGAGSGTSFSTPMVASAIAIINQFYTLSGQGRVYPLYLETLLYDNGADIIGVPQPQNARRIDIKKAMDKVMCYPDCNGDGMLNLADFGCFQTKFATQNIYSDCNGDGMLNLADFGCFQTKFAIGCS